MLLVPLCALLVALPWLWPFTSGPFSSMLPYLVSAGVAAVLWVLWPRQPERAALAATTGWAAAAGLSALIALLQYFNREASFYPWVNIAEPGQAFGNLRQPNQLATLLAIGLLALRWLRARGVLPSGAAAGAGALLLVALAATASRVGLVELLAVGALALWWGWRGGRSAPRAALTAVGALVVFALAALALPWLLQDSEGLAGRALVDRLQHAESTCGSRLILYRNVLHLIALKPWLGWGWGELAYAHYITLYDGPRFCHILDNAHNLPLHLAVELGVPAALLACAALVWAVWRGRPWAEANATRQLAWGVLAVIGIHSGVEYPLWYAPFQIAALICVWLLWATRARQASADSYQNDGNLAAGPGAARVALAAGLLAAVAYAGWDYHRISQIYLPADERAAPYRADAMGHARRSWLYQGAVRFADVTTRPAVRDNAAWMLPAALQALHFSPEPRVIINVIESATLLGRDDVALAHLARFRAAFPKEHADWVRDNARRLGAARDQLKAASEPAQSDAAVPGR
ncbi:Wzy polymerase domain-containing protein [Ottowia sp.]|uniref:PglL family O-oligosaccharyltransferase n=1 Tax=Ottowia sp. TaxID=1898956 RepID=UPI002BC8AC90|nr:Wzy polymerase domain-containing protein [Ottowia sp.]HOB67221.1 Wzy polymerase domain-containing protein [Ottowia sp.]HPZ57711.1 Wzy polymerase domain-containing protein [Ottowia sp.]HQD46429.1 Wzy polymerase domain-containing protein [Ottowia sp.]